MCIMYLCKVVSIQIIEKHLYILYQKGMEQKNFRKFEKSKKEPEL